MDAPQPDQGLSAIATWGLAHADAVSAAPLTALVGDDFREIDPADLAARRVNGPQSRTTLRRADAA